jgi:hypothetical protein
LPIDEVNYLSTWLIVGRFNCGYALSAHLSPVVICFDDEVIKLN